MALELPFLDFLRPDFPCATEALTEPDGLLAYGGNLQVDTLLNAYRQGIFPWYDPEQPILWWSPSQRAVFEPGDLHISGSLSKILRKGLFNITSDQAFRTVISQCAAPRSSGSGTWITEDMIEAYIALHKAGIAHSIEVWHKDQLVGGLYGVAVGGVFCGESMFSNASNASKVALIALSKTLYQSGYELIDAQIPNPHLSSMGCKTISRESYIKMLQSLRDKECLWPESFDYGI